MPVVLAKLAREAAEAFIKANRCRDKEEATLLRQKAYKLVDAIHERKRELR